LFLYNKGTLSVWVQYRSKGITAQQRSLCLRSQTLFVCSRAACSWYFLGSQHYCNLLLYLTTKHVFEKFGGQLPISPLSSWPGLQSI